MGVSLVGPPTSTPVGTDFNFRVNEPNVNMFENTLLHVMQPAMSRKGVAISLSRRRKIVWTYCEVQSFRQVSRQVYLETQ